MKAITRIAVLVLCLIFFTMAVSAYDVVPEPYGLISDDYQEPLPTRWMSPDGLPKLKHKAITSTEPLLVEESFRSSGQAAGQAVESGRIALIIHNSIYDAINQSVLEYIQDLQTEGYSVTIHRYVSGSAESLRTYLAGLYNEPAGLKGAILIGNIPYVIYEMMQDWDDYGGDPPEYEDFPCDIFYMDLNGTWSDTLTNGSVLPNNGKYDTRGGNLALEIWVGRIKADNLPGLGTEVSIINSYFAKVHSFRYLPTTPLRAVAYLDDDWSTMVTQDRSSLLSIGTSVSVTSYNQRETTTAAHYKTDILPLSTRWYLLRSHGYPGGHGFYRSNKTVFDYVNTSDYRNIDPPGVFYSLFVCSGCDYTSSNNLGATIALNPQSLGLLAVGTTKTGGMWDDRSFYAGLRTQSIGEAFRVWFNSVQDDLLAPQWWYGMVLLGDASLHADYPYAPGYNLLTISVKPEGSGVVAPRAGVYGYLPNQVIALSADPVNGYLFDHWDGDVVDPYSSITKVVLDCDKQVTAVFVSPTISKAKTANNGYSGIVADKIITCASSGYLYIEEDDRSSGIRVLRSGYGFSIGMRVTIKGTIQTDSGSCERYISPTNITIVGNGEAPSAVVLPNRSLGGGDFFYSTNPQRGQIGTKNGTGLNNIGLLVRSYGRFIPLDSTTFMIDDGTGAPIKCVVPEGVLINQAWNYVAVTGICGCYRSGNDILPMIQVRLQQDITVFE